MYIILFLDQAHEFSILVTIETLLGNEEIFYPFFFFLLLLFIFFVIASKFADFSALVAVSNIFPPQPSVNAEVDVAVLAALPQSMQLDILAQVRF